MPSLLAERAASEGPRSMRAVEDNLGHPLQILGRSRRRGKLDRTPMLLQCSRNARPQRGLVRRPQLEQHGCPAAMKLYKRREKEKRDSMDKCTLGWTGPIRKSRMSHFLHLSQSRYTVPSDVSCFFLAQDPCAFLRNPSRMCLPARPICPSRSVPTLGFLPR